jgi:mRNA interferase MazF
MRPVLIIRKFNKNIFLAIPLSTKVKPDNPYYIEISLHGQQISAMVSQIRVLDAKRLHKKIGTLDTADFDTVQCALRDTVFKNFAPTRESRGGAANADL